MESREWNVPLQRWLEVFRLPEQSFPGRSPPVELHAAPCPQRCCIRQPKAQRNTHWDVCGQIAFMIFALCFFFPLVLTLLLICHPISYLSVRHAETAAISQLALHPVSSTPLALSHLLYLPFKFYTLFFFCISSLVFCAWFTHSLTAFQFSSFPCASFLFLTCWWSVVAPSPHSIVAYFLCTRPCLLPPSKSRPEQDITKTRCVPKMMSWALAPPPLCILVCPNMLFTFDSSSQCQSRCGSTDKVGDGTVCW